MIGVRGKRGALDASVGANKGEEMDEICEIFVVRDAVQPLELFAGLPGKLTLRLEDSGETSVICLDTFDWRLYSRGFSCQVLEQGEYLLRDFAGENWMEAEWAPFTKKLLPADLPDSVLSAKLRQLAGIRALLPQVELLRRIAWFRILNGDQKTVLRGWLEENQTSGPGSLPLLGTLCLHAVRGYDKIHLQVRELLQHHGITPACPERMILEQALAAGGKKPDVSGSQFHIPLDPHESLIHAARKIFLELIGTMDTNRQGVIDDIDSEFLHDFRVALRRSRSLLSSIKKMLPPDDVAMLQADLQRIGLATGPVRDLDVYLLARQSYIALLPGDLQEGLLLFFQDLARQRTKERKRLKQFLTSAAYAQSVSRWRKYVEDSMMVNALEAGQLPCREVAIKAIRKRVKTILHDGALITPDSPDTALHALRIQAKKFRYLLEFYRSLFQEQEIDLLIKSLKKLQDNLGAFNDLSVQRRVLLHYQQGLATGEQKKAVQIAAALGGLITCLYEEQKQVRQGFEMIFAQFSAEENRSLIAQLF